MGDKKYMSKKAAILLLTCVFSFIFWTWFLPGPRVAVDYPLVSETALKSFFDIPRVWLDFGAEGLGEYSVYTIWSWPMMFISAVLIHLGFTFAFLERILLTGFILAFGSWGIWKTGQNIKLSVPAKTIAIIFYLTNTYILSVIDGGQMVVGMAYAFFPISFLAIETAIKKGWINKIIAAYSVWVLGFLDFRFVYILIILSFLRFIYEFLFLNRKEWGSWIKNSFQMAFVSLLIVGGMNAYWLVPIIKKPLSDSTYLMLTQTNFESFTTIGHSMFLIVPHWFKNIFGKISPLNFEFILIPIFVFLAPVFRPKDKTVGFWLIVVLLSVFLAKGASEPLSQVYPFLFHNIPGFSLFRDSTKFFFLVALSFTILLSISVDEIINKLKSTKAKILFPIAVIIYLLFLIRPVWLGQMTGTFYLPIYQQEYSKLNNIVGDDLEFSRIFWIPAIPPLGLIDDNHPSAEAARFVQKRPFAIGTKGTYEIFNFLREASFMGELFNVAGIGYIAYPAFDPRRDDLHPDNVKYYDTFSDQLNKLPWLSRIADSPIPLWKTTKHQNKFFVTSNFWWVVGSDSIYAEATTSSKLSLSNNALVFAEEYPGLSERMEGISDAKIILNNKTNLDLAASFIPASKFIFPSSKLKLDPDESGWCKRQTKDLIRFRYFLKTKYGIDNTDFDYGGGWAVGEGERKLKIESEKLKNGQILLARVMESSRSGKVSFYQDEQLVGEISTKIDKDTNVRWFEVGKISSDSPITVSSSGDINIINALIFVHPEDWSDYQNKALIYQQSIGKFSNAIDDSAVKVEYQKINSTKYKVLIRDFKGTGFLVFSESYDPLWQLDDKSSLPGYSLLNVFPVEKNGEYILEFKAQKFVSEGLLVTGLTVLSIGILMVILKTKL
ncbi:hypothetical protein HYW43_04850 [Candidatus Daviesbacteria bacterium]|nr:hypothetical protein [Candidatus Daviesbacteria bacterium]